MRRTAGLVAGLLLLAACGTGTVEQPGPEHRSTTGGSWNEQRLQGAPAVDLPTVTHAGPDETLVVMLSEEGVLQSHLMADGAEFEAGTRLETDHRYVGLGGVVPLEDGWFALGSGGLDESGPDEELTYEAVGFVSDDGLDWREVGVDGFTGPAEVTGLVSVDGHLTASGSQRTAADPSEGGFRAALWRSDDGRTWREVELPQVRRGAESYVAGLAVAGHRILAAGSVDNEGVLWVSEDAGDSWSRVASPALAGTWNLTGVAAHAETVVLTASPAGEDYPSLLLRSTDGGDSWAPVTAPPPVATEGYAPVWAAGAGFFTLTSRFIESWSQPEICYADITLCQQDSSETLYVSADGDTWSRLDTSGIGAGEDSEVGEVVGVPEGGITALRSEGDHLTAYTWPGGAVLPTAAEPPAPPKAELVEVPRSGPEIGVRYHVPLYLHCGMDWLYLRGTPWRRAHGGPDVETGAGDEVPREWPVPADVVRVRDARHGRPAGVHRGQRRGRRDVRQGRRAAPRLRVNDRTGTSDDAGSSSPAGGARVDRSGA